MEIKTIHLFHFIMHLGKSDRNGENTCEKGQRETGKENRREMEGREGRRSTGQGDRRGRHTL